jgi:TIR domain
MSDVRVFINYRRGDTRYVAGRLRDRIVSQFGADAVFVDVESIVPGQDYVDAIDSAVSRCTVMCVLIGETWLRPDVNGLRRIDDEDDRLRLEIEAGLRHRTVVIPVLVDDATMPLAEELPASVEPLARHQAMRVRYDSFTGDSDRLLTVIGRIAAQQEQSPVQTPVEAPHLDPTPLTTSKDAPSVVRRTARWIAVGTLVLTVLYLVGTTATMGAVVNDSRHDLPASGSWGAPVWLLPALPVLVAALLCLTRNGPGVALGCIAGAALWVFSSLVLVVSRAPDDPRGAHVVLLALLAVAATALVVGDRRLRARAPGDHDRPVLRAALLLLVAMALRGLAPWLAELLTGTSAQPFDTASFTGSEAFWLAVLTPALVCGPVIVAELSLVQLRALVTLATLQVLYPFVLRVLMFPAAADRVTPLVALVDDLLFLAGSMCMLSSVRTAQLRRLQHGVQALAGGAPVPH